MNARSNAITRRQSCALITAALAGLATRARAADPIEIGMAVALTGYLAAVDRQFVDGVKLATKMVNDGGGVNGQPLSLRIMDNASNATTGVTVTNQLLKQHDIKLMLNGALSALSVGIQPIVSKAEIPVIAVAQLPADASWIFLVGAAYQSTLETQLLFARDKLKARKIAFLHAQTPYGQNGAKLIGARAKALGLELVISESVAATSLDMTPQLARVKEATPDVLVDFITGPIHIVQAKAATTVGLDIPIVMAVDDNTIFEQAAAAYKNAYAVLVPVQAFPNISNGGVKAATDSFLNAYKTAGLDPHGIAGASWGWDAVHIAAAALKNSKLASGKALRETLEKADYVGTTAHYKFSPDDHTGQNATTALAVSRMSGSTHEIVWSRG
jgi:branched-chain amino acid transport system substrate-binding protein